METCNYIVGKANGNEYRCDLPTNHKGPHKVHLTAPIIIGDRQCFDGGPIGSVLGIAYPEFAGVPDHCFIPPQK